MKQSISIYLHLLAVLVIASLTFSLSISGDRVSFLESSLREADSRLSVQGDTIIRLNHQLDCRRSPDYHLYESGQC